MRTVSLKEAYAKATNGLLEINSDEPCTIRKNSGFKVADTWLESDSTLDQSKTNAALLAHTFNHFQEAVDLLLEIKASTDADNRQEAALCCNYRNRIDSLLSKASRVQIP